jgi:small subunit ribosomal protein S8
MNAIFFLIFKIKQAICKKKTMIFLQYTVTYIPFLLFLIKNNFILKYKKINKNLIVFLNYNHLGKPIINNIVSASIKSNIKHISYKNLFLYSFGISTLIILTPFGYVTQNEALKKKIGGILLCIIY